jgi:GNAT superfamily N-acetyltransferase
MHHGKFIDLLIVRAKQESLPAINALIARSKAYWAWPVEYLEQALLLHRIDADYLLRHHNFEVRDTRDELVGFFSVAASDDRVVLDNLWVSPEWIGQGIGRRACEYAFKFARDHEWTQLWVMPDPPAEGFYLRLGFVDTGERVSSRVRGGPLFSVYRLRL